MHVLNPAAALKVNVHERGHACASLRRKPKILGIMFDCLFIFDYFQVQFHGN